MKSQMAKKDRNTTDLRLAFVISFRECSKESACCFFWQVMPCDPNYNFLSQSFWKHFLYPSVPVSFFLAAGEVHQLRYESCLRVSS